MFKRDWAEADAVVIMARNFVSTGEGNAGLPSKTELVLEVHPKDGAPFRAETTMHLLGLNQDYRNYLPAQQGETVRVKHKDNKVEVVLDDAHDRRLQKKHAKDAMQDALHAAPGTPAPTNPVTDAIAAALAAAGVSADDATTTTTTSITIDSIDGVQDVPVTRGDPTQGGAAGILANGVPGTAVLLASFPLGQKTSLGEDATALVLQVSVPGQEPFQSQMGLYVPPEAQHLLVPGTSLPVKCLTGSTQAVAVDWNAALQR